MKRREIAKEEIKTAGKYGAKKAKTGALKAHSYAQKRKQNYLMQREKDKASLREIRVKERALKRQARMQQRAKPLRSRIKAQGVRSKVNRNSRRRYNKSKQRNDLQRRYPYQSKKINLFQ